LEGVSFGALFLLISSELLKGGDKTGGRSALSFDLTRNLTFPRFYPIILKVTSNSPRRRR